MQEKISDLCLRGGSEYPLLPNGRVPSGRIFRSEPQHMTYMYIIIIIFLNHNLPIMIKMKRL
jgi:hypothetical protein